MRFDNSRAIVFTATGDEHFSVGMDLKQLMTGAADREGMQAFLEKRRPIFTGK